MENSTIGFIRPAKVNGSEYWTQIFKNKVIDRALLAETVKPIDERALFKDYVTVVNIELTSFCNRKCSYCPVSFLEDRRGKIQHISDEVFHKIIADLEEIDFSEKLLFNLYNEPLASKKEFYKKMRYVKKRLPNARLFFNSNGDYIDVDTLDELSNIGITFINITRHSKGEYIHNERLNDLEGFYKKIDVPLKLDSEKVNSYIHSSFIYKGMKVGVSCVNYDELGHSRAGAMDKLIIEQDRDYPCYKPFREFSIYYTGDVYPCCNLLPDIDTERKYALGHILKEESIFAIYNNELSKRWRASLFGFSNKKKPCDKCSERECTVDREDNPIRDDILKQVASNENMKLFL